MDPIAQLESEIDTLVTEQIALIARNNEIDALLAHKRRLRGALQSMTDDTTGELVTNMATLLPSMAVTVGMPIETLTTTFNNAVNAL